jgi:predicted ester cyclase
MLPRPAPLRFPGLAFKSGHGGVPVSIGRQEPEFARVMSRLRRCHKAAGTDRRLVKQPSRGIRMSLQDDNKAIVGRWFTDFWGENGDLSVVDKIAAPDMLLKYSLHEPRKGREDIKAFMTDFRAAFPDLNFWGTADLIAEGDHVVARWEGGGTHTGPAFKDFLAGSLPANTGRKMHFTGVTVLKLKDGKIVEEIGLDDGVACLTQLKLLRTA